jgi:catechol 2,3-dioxygenase-like lactoylglutathione lyase family enzyme
MKLNHLNICTQDPEGSAEFFVKYFGFTRETMRQGAPLALVHDEEGFTLTFLNLSKQSESLYPEGFHFGFIVKSREEVDRLFSTLAADGYASIPPKEVHGSYTFYFTSPAKVTMEVQIRLP